jgi:ATP/maltotriose-dependent transcriptional regulator MalT
VRVLLERGHVKEARELVDRLAEQERNRKDWDVRLPLAVLLARVQAAEGKLDEARASLQAVVSEAHQKGLVQLELEAALTLAEIDRAAGRGKTELVEVERRARERGLGLIARHAARKLR